MATNPAYQWNGAPTGVVSDDTALLAAQGLKALKASFGEDGKTGGALGQLVNQVVGGVTVPGLLPRLVVALESIDKTLRSEYQRKYGGQP